MNDRSNVLIVEDDPEMVLAVTKILDGLGLSADSFSDGKAGLEAALSGEFSLVVLDVQLPSLDGWEICRRLRAVRPHQLILMLTAESDEVSTVLGLELGADAYIAKPFRAKELRARVNALLRRGSVVSSPRSVPRNSEQALTVIRSGALLVDLDAKQVLVHDVKVSLTPIEFNLLVTFLQNPAKVLSANELAFVAMGYSNLSEHGAPVRPHLSRLRRKLASAGLPANCISSQPGFGYRLQLFEVER